MSFGHVSPAHLDIPFPCCLLQHFADMEGARKVLSEALAVCPGSRTLWEGAIFFEELSSEPDRTGRVMALYDRAVETSKEAAAAADDSKDTSSNSSSSKKQPWQELSREDRELLSSRAVEFADMYGDHELLQRVEARHAAEFMLPAHAISQPAASGGAVVGKGGEKRPAEAAAAAPAPVAKVHRSEAAAVAAGTPPSAHADPAAAMQGYGYPPPPSGYGGYSGYGYGQYPGYGYGYGY